MKQAPGVGQGVAGEFTLFEPVEDMGIPPCLVCGLTDGILNHAIPGKDISGYAIRHRPSVLGLPVAYGAVRSHPEPIGQFMGG